MWEGKLYEVEPGGLSEKEMSRRGGGGLMSCTRTNTYINLLAPQNCVPACCSPIEPFNGDLQPSDQRSLNLRAASTTLVYLRAPSGSRRTRSHGLLLSPDSTIYESVINDVAAAAINDQQLWHRGRRRSAIDARGVCRRLKCQSAVSPLFLLTIHSGFAYMMNASTVTLTARWSTTFY